MYQKPVDQFLRKFYLQFGIKVRRIIELNKPDATSVELTEMFETKGKLLEALNYMSHVNTNKEIQSLFRTLGKLAISLNNDTLNMALEFCERMQQKPSK
jgi:hypothetical protein